MLQSCCNACQTAYQEPDDDATSAEPYDDVTPPPFDDVTLPPFDVTSAPIEMQCPPEKSVNNAAAIKLKGAKKQTLLLSDRSDMAKAACECAALCGITAKAVYWNLAYTWRKLKKMKCYCYTGVRAKLKKVAKANKKKSGFAGGFNDDDYKRLVKVTNRG